MQLHERSFGGFRLRPKPPTRWDEGSSSRCSRRKREAQRCQPISTAVRQYSLTQTASRKSTKTIKSTRLTIRRGARRIQSKKRPVEKGRFRLAESDCCMRNGRTHQAGILYFNKYSLDYRLQQQQLLSEGPLYGHTTAVRYPRRGASNI